MGGNSEANRVKGSMYDCRPARSCIVQHDVKDQGKSKHLSPSPTHGNLGQKTHIDVKPALSLGQERTSKCQARWIAVVISVLSGVIMYSLRGNNWSPWQYLMTQGSTLRMLNLASLFCQMSAPWKLTGCKVTRHIVVRSVRALNK